MPKPGTPLEVFVAFLRLGCTSFGGPIAHLAYYRREFVDRRRWCSEPTLAEIIALAQSLPGPASTQTGYTLGILRAGPLGGIAAFLGFTLPSALLMFAFALIPTSLASPIFQALLHGLQLVAVAVVAQAVFAMQRSLAPDFTRIALALAATALLLFLHTPYVTLLAILLGATTGLLFFRRFSTGLDAQGRDAAGLGAAGLDSRTRDSDVEPLPVRLSKSTGVVAGGLFGILLVASLIPTHGHNPATLFSTLYRNGALVFGGGHVVLPLLEASLVYNAQPWLSQSTFLAGYGAAQALPGPLFAIAAHLGASIGLQSSWVYAAAYSAIALIALFLPGLLLITAALPFWTHLRQNYLFRSALLGINAAVVGILLAALYQPLWTTTIHSPLDVGFAATAFLLLTAAHRPPWQVVLLTVSMTVALSLLHS